MVCYGPTPQIPRRADLTGRAMGGKITASAISLNVNLAKYRGGVKHLGSELSELCVSEQAAASHVPYKDV